ncbi:DUF3578 domain-containing protein [Kiritimatiellota bacterium B12222]|nr:DUF3578 domain-containing protein [Kiritimatiellota bacterium B12222]
MGDKSKFTGFKKEAFNLLESYAANPDQAYDKKLFDDLIRNPFKELQSEIFPELSHELKGYNLTEKKARSQHANRTNKLFGHFWAAIYRDHRDGKSDDLQHFWYISKNHFKFGLYIGKHAQDLGEKIIQHVVNEKTKALELSTISVQGKSLKVTVCDTNGYLLKELSIGELNADDELINKHGLDFCFEFSLDETVKLGANLPDVINEGFSKLRPLYRFLLEVDPPPYQISKNDIIEETFSKDEESLPFSINAFVNALHFTDLVLDSTLPASICSALHAKPFLILTGLSGSGKTKLAQAFSTWICETKDQVKLIAVGADWTSNENLLGYPDALNPKSYRKPDNGVLELILAAQADETNPYFLILDEMNLSHVERYFADFLSAMESGEAMQLHAGKDELWDGVTSEIKIPKNLFVIGTVNVDETTYMFSPKVLDRANVIEFRVNENEMASFLAKPVKPDLKEIEGHGKGYGKAFVTAAKSDVTLDDALRSQVSDVLMTFFPALKEAGAEFGYRTAHEICRFVYFHQQLSGDEWNFDVAMDAAVMQKLLPKLHGSKKKLGPILEKLIRLCLKTEKAEEYTKDPSKIDLLTKENARYPVSFEKVERMRQRLAEHGFTSFAEA